MTLIDNIILTLYQRLSNHGLYEIKFCQTNCNCLLIVTVNLTGCCVLALRQISDLRSMATVI